MDGSESTSSLLDAGCAGRSWYDDSDIIEDNGSVSAMAGHDSE